MERTRKANGRTDGRTDRQTDRQTDRRTDGQTDGQKDGVHDILRPVFDGRIKKESLSLSNVIISHDIILKGQAYYDH